VHGVKTQVRYCELVMKALLAS